MAPILAKVLNRLSRDGLIDLALRWLQHTESCPPYLLENRKQFEADEEDYLHEPAETIEDLRELYELYRQDVTRASKRDIIDRIIDGDWRRGLSLQQHAMLDFAVLEEHDSSLRWTALRLVPRQSEEEMCATKDQEPARKKRRITASPDIEATYPQLSPATFVTTLRSEISPLVKAHYHLHRLSNPANLSVVRLYISPNGAIAPRRGRISKRGRSALDGGRVMYVALQDSCPYIYISLSGAPGSAGRPKNAKDAKGRTLAKIDMTAMKKIVLEAIPKAFSKPHQRWALESTSLTARSLKGIVTLRGNTSSGSGGGAFGSFAQVGDGARDKSPVEMSAIEKENRDERRQQLDERFGPGEGTQYAALDRVHVKILNLGVRDVEDDGLDLDEPGSIGITFCGNDVFRGLRMLAELGPEYVDLDKMPAWMTGEYGQSTISV